MIDRTKVLVLFFVVVLAVVGAAPSPLQAQPDDLLGFRLGQDMGEVKKAHRVDMHMLMRGRTDEVLRNCGMETFEIVHEGERLLITSIRGRIAKLDLSKSLSVLDPIAVASQFVGGYGAPRKTACKLLSRTPEIRTVPSQCGKKQTFVELHYWRGVEEPETMVAMRVRLRSQAAGNGVAHTRVTLSRGWEARLAKLAACSEDVAQDLRAWEADASSNAGPAGRSTSWWDPNLDPAWVPFYRPQYD